MGQPTSADGENFWEIHGPADIGSEPELKGYLSEMGDSQKFPFQLWDCATLLPSRALGPGSTLTPIPCSSAGTKLILTWLGARIKRAPFRDGGKPKISLSDMGLCNSDSESSSGAWVNIDPDSVQQ